jgi:peptide deformylase
MKVKILALAAFALAFAACSPKGGWTPAELDIISADLPLPVLTIFDREENIFLRTPCSELSAEEIRSEHYGTLCKALLGTVTDPSQDGVGIAGPQVGLGRRIVAVQRFDREG